MLETRDAPPNGGWPSAPPGAAGEGSSEAPRPGARAHLSLSSRTVEDVTFLKLEGVIDEDNPLARSLKKLDGSTVVIDLEGVRRINSCGVRDWVNWLADLDARGKSVILVRCSPTIVNQLNLVNNFGGKALVKSFFAPYHCARCDIEQQELLQVEDFAGTGRPQAPPVRGKNCAQTRCELAFDDIEDAFFAFLPRSNAPAAEGPVAAALARLSPSLQARIARLDSPDETSADRNPSAIFSPLTVTSTSHGIASRDSLSGPPSAPPEPVRRSPVPLILTVTALALAALIAAYVFLGGGRRG